METCCAGRKNELGTYKGTELENDVENQQKHDLYELLRGKEWITIRDIRGGRDAEALHRCPKCGQLWTWHEGPRDVSIYQKINESDARLKFPGFK